MVSDWLKTLTEHDVSIWVDALSRDRVRSGKLADLVAHRHVSGVTSNPTIFRAALADGQAYEDQIRDLVSRRVAVEEAARLLTADDVRAACDVLLGEFTRTAGRDGRVSFEVDPRLAHDAAATVAEARALVWLVDRPNLMIKIPATDAGLEAISQVTAEGISVNVTLIFGLARYKGVVDAYLSGLEAAASAGRPLGDIRSVASLFISRVDVKVDKDLERIGTDDALALRGLAGVASARLCYQHFVDALAARRWAQLAEEGAHPQRLLWASTGVKDARYPATKYVSELVAPQTVSTMPEATLAAVVAAGSDGSGPRLDPRVVIDGARQAAQALAEITSVGVNVESIVGRLESDGVAQFAASWAELLGHLRGLGVGR